MQRFCHLYNHWLRRLFTKDRCRKIGICLLGVVGARDDDYSSVRYAGSLLWKCFLFGSNLGVVLQDAFSSRYKNALHSGAFEDAVKKYRQKKKAQVEKKVEDVNNRELNIPTKIPPSALEETSARAQQSLESLPGRALEQARVFHRHIQYFAHAEPERDMPPDLKLMLDDISRAQKLDERVKNEILQDEDARNVSTSLYLTLQLK